MTKKTKIMKNTRLYASIVNATYSDYTDYYDKNYARGENTVQTNVQMYNIYEEIGIMMVLSVFCLLGIIGNGLVIWICIKMKKTVNVVWFLNLAVTDFSFAFILPLFHIQIALGYWPFLTIMCKIINFSLYCNLAINVLQFTVISIDRCICVVFPVWCHNHRRPRLAYIIVLTIRIISVVVSIPYALYADKVDIDNNTMICLLIFKKSGLVIEGILTFILRFLLPFLIIVSCYILIFFYLRRKRISISGPIKTSVAVTIAFFICWFPVHLYNFLAVFLISTLSNDVVYYENLTAALLMVINCFINPIFYLFIGQDVKEKFCGSFRAKIEKAFTEGE
ncbi:chemerin-like receptor 1 [Dendropsophus ebraccatus]|uniref:chemerin-like receptor 1 n=1 Tax=Dendropsophus ebraccatus TaxID=150705 RepID=UPI0038310934